MSDFETPVALSPTAPDPWEADLARLRERFPRANASVLICIHALQQAPDISLDDMRARAAMHGIRITAASLLAARRALGLSPPMGPRARRQEPIAVDDGESTGNGVAATAAIDNGLAPDVPQRRQPARGHATLAGPSRTHDLERALRRFVAQADEERQRVREAVRRVIEVIDEALG